MRETAPQQGPIHRHPEETPGRGGGEGRGDRDDPTAGASRRHLADLQAPLGLPERDVSADRPRSRTQLICHHCHAEPLPRRCPRLRQDDASQTGAGTQRIERLLAEELAPMPVFALTPTPAPGPGGHATIPSASDGRRVRFWSRRWSPKGHGPRSDPCRDPRRRCHPPLPRLPGRGENLSLVAQLAGPQRPQPDRGKVIVPEPWSLGSPFDKPAATHDPPAFGPASSTTLGTGLSAVSHQIRIQLAG